MRRTDLAAIAALLIVLPAAAHAGPVIPFVQGVVAAFGAGGAFASTTVLGLAARAVLSIGLSALSRRLQQRRQSGQTQDLLANYAQPVSYMERCYGIVRKGGPLGFSAFGSPARHYTVIIAAHRTKGPLAHWLDKLAVTVDSNGAVLTPPILSAGSPTHGSIRAYRGAAGQLADGVLDSYFGELTPAHNYAGLSYVALYASRAAQERQASIYTTGREWVYTGLWEMCDTIFDPRDGVTKFTRNAALIIAHEMIFWGKTVDWAEVGAQADICEEAITPLGDTVRPRWLIDGVFSDDMEWESVQEQLAMACDAWFYERPDGKSGFKVGAWSEPTVTLTMRDFLAVTVSDGAFGPDEPGAFSVRYIEHYNDYIEAVSSPYVIQAGPREEVACPLISHHNQAVRVAKRLGRSRLARYSVSGTVKLIGYDLIGQRFVRVTLSDLALDIVIEVDRLTRNADGMTFSLEGRSATAADFAFNSALDEPARVASGAVSVSAPQPGITAPDFDLDATLTVLWTNATGGQAKMDWTWNAQPAGLRQDLWVQFTDDPGGAGATDVGVYSVPEGQRDYAFFGPLSGRYFIGRVRNVASSGVVSAWEPEDGVIIQWAGSGALPAALPLFTATVVGADVRLDFRGPNDPVYVGVNLYRAIGSTVFASASLVRTNYSFANVSDFWTDVAPGSGLFTYWAKPINSFASEGPLSSPVTVTL